MPQFIGRSGQGGEEERLDNPAGMARHFYYGTDEQAVSLKSKDFDDVYAMTGQSHALS